MPHTIRTERLLLRPPSLRDVRDYVRVLGDWDIVSRTGTWSFPLTHKYVAFRLSHARSMEPLVDHVFVAEERGRFAGTVGIHATDEPEVFTIGYWLGKAFWGRGLATEGLRAVCDFGFRVCRAKELRGDAFADNPASFSVMTKVGMRPAGDGMGWSTARTARLPIKSFKMTRTDFRP